jgi:alpha-tubulin suppressor-like RCC1 family protein
LNPPFLLFFFSIFKHSFLLKESGEILSCGWGADGQTGQGHYDNQSDPSPVKGDVAGRKIVKLSSAGDCVLALDSDGNLFGWGNSEYSQLKVGRHLASWTVDPKT